MQEEKRSPMEALSDETLAAVTGGDAIAYPCVQCGQTAWERAGTYTRPFTGQPGGPRIGTIYVCGVCKRRKAQGLVDEVPELYQ